MLVGAGGASVSVGVLVAVGRDVAEGWLVGLAGTGVAVALADGRGFRVGDGSGVAVEVGVREGAGVFSGRSWTVWPAVRC